MGRGWRACIARSDALAWEKIGSAPGSALMGPGSGRICARVKRFPSLFAVLEEIGLKLESGRAPVETLMVDHAMKSSPGSEFSRFRLSRPTCICREASETRIFGAISEHTAGYSNLSDTAIC